MTDRVQCERCGRITHVLHECSLCKKRVCPTCYRNMLCACKDCMPGR